jgi:ADP-ribose pyrophosphatase YjhB (NUDIX family)
MFPSLPPETRSELEQLVHTYGQPVIHIADLDIRQLFNPLHNNDRYGEVCMVVRRPNGLLLSITKEFYPREIYRLPTGGINHGEPIFHALLRETAEETGLTVNVSRFLAAVAYRTAFTGDNPIFYSFAFLLDEVGGTLGALDANERIENFLEIDPSNLPLLADRLEHLAPEPSVELEGHLRDWGLFRAVIHRTVWQALNIM